jgi:hypothetical protein
MSEESRPSAKERSPNYPSIGLPSAIDLARKLWNAEKRTAVPPEIAARALGYNSLSGASRAALAALRQYDLIDNSGGTVALSPLAVDILVHPQESEEWEKAVLSAARAPEMFRELRESHADASDSAINAYIITRKRFSVDGAQKFIRAFRETAALVNRLSEGYTGAPTENAYAPGEDVTMTSPTATQQSVGNQQVTAMQFLLGGGIRAEIRFFGGAPEPQHIQMLEAYLKVTGAALQNPS